jgi:hypothetical protein
MKRKLVGKHDRQRTGSLGLWPDSETEIISLEYGVLSVDGFVCYNGSSTSAFSDVSRTFMRLLPVCVLSKLWYEILFLILCYRHLTILLHP